MQLQKLSFPVLLIIFIFFTFTKVTAQPDNVVRIIASNCKYNNNKVRANHSTGFVFKVQGRVQGIITTLHGVCGCDDIMAETNSGKDFFKLKIDKVDVDNDVALLTSPEVLSYFKSGYEFSTTSPRSLSNTNVEMIFYPYETRLRRDNKLMRITSNPIVKLHRYIKDGFINAVKKRNSPNYYADVLDLEAEIVPGASGAPIIYKNKVIGIANGGLDKGRTHICWGIPINMVRMKSPSAYGGTYTNLEKSDPNKLFVLTAGLSGGPNKKPKPKPIPPKYEIIYSPHFGPDKSPGWDDFNVAPPNYQDITNLKVKSYNYVDGIRVTWKGGHTGEFNYKDGLILNEIPIPNGVYITKIEGRKVHDAITDLTFYLSDGQKIPLNTRQGHIYSSEPFAYEIPQGAKLIGFQGQFYTWLRNIKFILARRIQ